MELRTPVGGFGGSGNPQEDLETHGWIWNPKNDRETREVDRETTKKDLETPRKIWKLKRRIRKHKEGSGNAKQDLETQKYENYFSNEVPR